MSNTKIAVCLYGRGTVNKQKNTVPADFPACEQEPSSLLLQLPCRQTMMVFTVVVLFETVKTRFRESVPAPYPERTDSELLCLRCTDSMKCRPLATSRYHFCIWRKERAKFAIAHVKSTTLAKKKKKKTPGTQLKLLPRTPHVLLNSFYFCIRTWGLTL